MINIPKTAIFVPTFKRADRMLSVHSNIMENSPNELVSVYFILEPSDQQSIQTAKALGVSYILNEGQAGYADSINTAYHQTNEELFFSGADDLNFHTNWLANAMRYLKHGIGVVGTNDLGGIPIGPERDATHYLVKRSYIRLHSGRVDASDTVLYPYDHNYTDKEFVETARYRNAYVYAPDAVVEHIHPAWGKASMDETYKRGLRLNEQDRQLFISRKHLWGQ